MKKRFCIIFIIAMVVACMGVPSLVFASDTSANGTYKYVTVMGNKYKYYASIYTRNNKTAVQAYMHAWSNEYENYPVGYMGSNARLYNAQGTLVKADGWKYNDTVSGGMSSATSKHYASGTFYSKGGARFYNGDGYNTYTSTKSPNVQITFRSSRMYNVNANEEIYGSEIFLNQYNIEPDLIEALGDNGIVGYVKATDLEEREPMSLSEAKEYMEKLPDQRKISLYERDGETIIGTFTIDYSPCQAVVY